MARSAEEKEIFSVSGLTRAIKFLFEQGFPGTVWVEGEISNFKRHSSGHLYFVLKDEVTQVNVTMFRSAAARLKFEPEDGLKVVVRGGVGIYERRGEYQVNARGMDPVGLGQLQLAFEQLKEKLLEEGLFDEDHKQAIPDYPGCIGIVTSPTGAAIRDILNVMTRRFAGVRVLIYPVRVQGDQAAGEIAGAIEAFNRLDAIRPDVMIVGRGGGSIEDLWPFNEEVVARAIFASRVPVISAVGHEVDWTISDYVADLRGPTPSAAAELVVKDRREIEAAIGALRGRLKFAVDARVQDGWSRLRRCRDHYALREPANLVGQFQRRVDELTERMQTLCRHGLEMRAQRLAAAARHLDALSPLGVLGRGYSVCRQPDGGVISAARQCCKGQLLEVTFADDGLLARVEDIRPSCDRTATGNNAPD